MAWKKTHDLAVKTGTKPDGKGRYENVGMVMRSDDGGEMLLLKRTFNPAGVNSEKDSIVLSRFEVRDRDGAQSSHNQAKSNGYQQQEPLDELDDEVPF